MFYSDDIVEEIRSRNDIVDLIGEYTTLKKRGSSYMGCCPFHHEKTPSFSVSREKQMYHCFGCGVGGNIFTFVMEYENFSFPEALKMLADRASISLPEQEMTAEQKKLADYKYTLGQMNKQAANYFYLLLKKDRGEHAYEYLTNRGITEDTIKKFALGYADIYSDDLYKYLKANGYNDELLRDSGLVTIDEKKGGMDKFWNRVMYPILDINSKVIGFGGRVLGEGNPKYLNSKETKLFDKSRNLYGMNFARTSRRKGFILCEGYMDVISMHQAGFDNAVASLGTAFTIGQASILKRYTDEVYLAYDSDQAGIKACLRAIPILKEVGIRTRVISMKPHKDPDEFIKNLGQEAFEDRISNAISSFMFEIEIISMDYNQNDPESKTAFHHAIANKLATISEPLERKNYIEAVAGKFYIGTKELTELVNYYGNKNGFSSQANISYDEKPPTIREDKEEAKFVSQRLLLTWLINETSLFDKLKGTISSEDFFEPLYNNIATRLFEQYYREKKVIPAAIINQYTDLEEQKKVANIFQTSLKMAPLPEDNDKAITDIVKKVKLSSIENEMNNTNDMNKWQELIKQKGRILKLHISL